MIQNAFNSGEITPLLHGRPDVGVYASGCKRLLNMRAMLYGGATRDPGLEHLGFLAADDRARLFPFEFSNAARYVLEITYQNGRIWSTGDTPAVVAEVATPYQTVDLRAIQFAQLNDIVIFTHPDWPPQLLSRTAADTFTWEDFPFTDPPFRDQNEDPDHELTLTLPNVVGSPAWVTATAYIAGQGASYSGVDYLCTRSHTSGASTRPDLGATYNKIKLERGADGRIEQRLVKLPWWQVAPDQAIAPAGSLVTLTSTLPIFDSFYIGEEFLFAFRRSLTERRARTNIPATSSVTGTTVEVDGEFSVSTTGNWTGTVTIEQSDDLGKTWNDILIYESAANANYNETHVTASNVLLRASIVTTAGVANAPKVTITAADPFSRAVVRVTGVTSTTIATVEALSPLKNEEIAFWSYAAFSKRMGFPTACTFHRQRLWFAGSAAEPQKVWASAIDQYDIFRRRELADESADEDQSFAFNIISSAQNRLAFLSSQKELVAGTSAGEWIIAGDQQTGKLAPGSYQVLPLAHFGSEPVQPLDAQIGLIFLQRGARSVRHIGALTDILYTPPELEQLSLFGEHLIRQGIVEHAYQRSPQPVYWAVTADGRLVGHTHKPDQRVLAWHDHDLGATATIESVAVCFSDTEEDQVWLSIAHVAGEETVRTIERFALGQLEAQESDDFDAFRFLHHFQVFEAATDGEVLTLLDFAHLTGRTLSIYHGGQLVDTVEASDEIYYTAALAGTYVIGCAFESLVETLPPVLQTNRGTMGFLTVSRIGRCHVLPWKSGPFSYTGGGSTDTVAVDIRPEGTPLEDLPPLTSEPVQIDGIGGHSTRPTVAISTSEPYPFTVLAINYGFSADQSV